jgi:hypothetical protein
MAEAYSAGANVVRHSALDRLHRGANYPALVYFRAFGGISGSSIRRLVDDDAGEFPPSGREHHE